MLAGKKKDLNCGENEREKEIFVEEIKERLD